MPGYPEFSLVGSHCLLLPGTGGTRLEREKSSEVEAEEAGGAAEAGTRRCALATLLSNLLSCRTAAGLYFLQF